MSQAAVESLKDFVQEPLDRPSAVNEDDVIPEHLQLFVRQVGVVFEKVQRLADAGALSADRATEFRRLLVDVGTRVLCHPVIASNNYLRRFALGVTESQASSLLKNSFWLRAVKIRQLCVTESRRIFGYVCNSAP